MCGLAQRASNASGGKSKASAGLKFVSPAKMTHAIVIITPIHNHLPSRSMIVIFR